MGVISFEMVLLSTQDKLDGFVVDWRIAKENGLTVWLNWNFAFIFVIENILWMLRGIASLRRFFWAPKTGVKIEIDGWDSFSSLPSWRAVFLFTMEKNVMDAH